MVYILRKNFRFAQELKSDQFAVSSKEDFRHFLHGIQSMMKAEEAKADKHNTYKRDNTYDGNAFADSDDELMDRLRILAMRGDSHHKRVVFNLCYSVVFLALFAVSYMFIILPAFWESPDVPVAAEDFGELREYREDGGILRAEENFLIDNSDGTFSLYIDSQFVRYIDETNEIFNLLPIYAREYN